MKTLMAAVAAAFMVAAGPAFASGLITKPSPDSVAAVEGAGAKVFARVDHAAGAASVGMELRPTQMLMFGNPKLGTPALQADQSSGLDLPLRVVVYQDQAGQVHVAYHSPARLAEDHDVPADAPVLKKMTGALNNLTDKAIGK